MLTREQLLSRREELLLKLKSKEAQEFEYVVGRPLYQFGCVCEMPKEVLVPAFAKIKELSSNLSEAAKELGIDYDDKSEQDILGYPVSEWKQDFKTRIDELANTEVIDRLKNALVLIEKNLSEEDKFKLDMEAVAGLLCED